ncbi:MAG TPA: hypothetical protein DDZ81_07125 [Acetobacteraceae bacterium]|nr:hypothetical protein [Acetobacteraceae bacterium]
MSAPDPPVRKLLPVDPSSTLVPPTPLTSIASLPAPVWMKELAANEVTFILFGPPSISCCVSPATGPE